MKFILLPAFLLLSCTIFAQQELSYKIGTKTTGKETISKETLTQTSNPAVVAMQRTGDAEIAETIGALKVTPSGAAVYTIPIALPPALVACCRVLLYPIAAREEMDWRAGAGMFPVFLPLQEWRQPLFMTGGWEKWILPQAARETALHWMASALC
ncbi:MAG: hypothetical protein QM763_06055 [Agriterribacter sp.]